MERLNRDAIVAIVLLMACGILFWATFDIRVPDYGQLRPSTWPRTILALLTLLSVIYLVQSLRHGEAPQDEYESADVGVEREAGVVGWLSYWRNPLSCFGLFFIYLFTLPYLGSLIGGVAFVFSLMGVLGGWAPKRLVVHVSIAVATVGGMWSIFTYGLGVILPQGELLSVF